MAGNCPKCGAMVTQVKLDKINVIAHPTHWLGVSYSCFFCNAVLSVAIDPIALKSDTVDEILQAFGKH